jgi:alpha-D-xyloside xylohydrolase
MKKRNLIFVFCFLTGGVFAQNSEKGSQGVKTNIHSMDVEVQFFSPSIVRVVKSPEGKKYTKESLSVIKTPEKVDLTVVKQENSISMSSSKLTVNLNPTTGKVVFSDVNGNQLFAEKDYGTQFADFNDAGVPSYRVRQVFMLEEDEVIYGLGQQQTGRMNQRNQILFLRNKNMHICIPIIHSTKGYAVFWDNYSPTTFTDNPWETSFDSEVGDCSDYYFMYGGNADGVIANLRDLTGQAPMYPLWTLGFW